MSLKPNYIQAILFDLDGTLRYNQPSANQAFLDFAAQAGVHVSPTVRLKTLRWTHYYWAQSPELIADLQTFGDLTEAFWDYYATRTLTVMGCPPEQASLLSPPIRQRMINEYQPEDRVSEDVVPTLQALKEAGFAMGVASNRSTPYDEQIAALGLSEYFAFALAAGQIQAWKPEPGIFLHAAELLKAEPHRTLYVGDNYFADVLGARRAGLQPVLFDPERIFSEADCPIIYSMGELLTLLAETGFD